MVQPSTFTLTEVREGVFAAIAPGTASAAVSNAAIVDLGDKTLVFDSFQTLRAAEELAAAVLHVTGRPAFIAVNSHWHSDHVGGNQVFAGAPIVGTKRMLELIAADAAQTRATYDEQLAAMESAAGDLMESSDAGTRQRGRGMRELVDALRDERDRFILTLPDLLIDSRLVIEGATRRVELVTHGRGHTESDVFAHLPEDGVVLAGDLVWSGIHPKTDDGFPDAWNSTVERIAALGAELVVPGHGPVGDADTVSAMARYQAELALLVAEVAAGEADAETAAPPSGSEEWDGIGRFRAGLSRLAGRASR